MNSSPDKQVSLTDPDARSMKNREGGIVGYNVQTAVDAEHHLIVAHEVINEGSDRDQLATMAEKAKQALGTEELTVIADRGYFKGERILECTNAGITALVPKSITSNSRAEGRFEKQDFIYVTADDEYRCPAGERAIWRMTTIEHGQRLHRYLDFSVSPVPAQGAVHDRRLSTHHTLEHEAVLERMQERLDRKPDSMRVRRRTAEHPFGTLKMWMGATHFLTRTLARVRTEMSLHVLAYNLKRLMQILGIGRCCGCCEPEPRLLSNRAYRRTGALQNAPQLRATPHRIKSHLPALAALNPLSNPLHPSKSRLFTQPRRQAPQSHPNTCPWRIAESSGDGRVEQAVTVVLPRELAQIRDWG